MAEDLATVRRRVSRKFLGKAGIHGVGLHPSIGQTLAIYRKPGDEAEDAAIIADLKKEVGPFGCEIIEDAAPTILADTGPGETPASSGLSGRPPTAD